MKKALILILVFAMMSSALIGCGKEEESLSVSDLAAAGEIKTGVLSHMVAMSADDTMVRHIKDQHSSEFQGDGERILYNNISSALLALKSNEIQVFGTNTATANYIVANNDEFVTFTPPGVLMQTEFSMLTMENSTEAYQILNDAILALKQDGRLDQLVETYINSPDGIQNTDITIPEFEGADTIRVAVTGDVPPLDYVTVDGKPAGFNVALLAAIAEQTGVNMEIVPMESGSRATALASGKVDAIFWVCATLCKEHPEIKIRESIANTKATEPYIVLDAAMVKKK